METERSTRRIASLARALADPTRVAILRSLAGGERCVCDLTDELAAAQSRLSFHLKILKDAGLISARPEGRMTYYALRRGSASDLGEFLEGLRRATKGRR